MRDPGATTVPAETGPMKLCAFQHLQRHQFFGGQRLFGGETYAEGLGRDL